MCCTPLRPPKTVPLSNAGCGMLPIRLLLLMLVLLLVSAAPQERAATSSQQAPLLPDSALQSATIAAEEALDKCLGAAKRALDVESNFQLGKKRVAAEKGRQSLTLLFVDGMCRWTKYISPLPFAFATNDKNPWLDMTIPALRDLKHLSLTSDMSKLASADIVLFCDEVAPVRAKKIVAELRPNQATAAWGLEPSVLEFIHHNIRIDYLISYHRLSEVRIDYSHYIPTFPTMYQNLFAGSGVHKRDDAYGATFISGCYDTLARKHYFTALAGHGIPIHHYGKCMHTPQLPETPHTHEFKYLLSSEYQYCFAFENYVLSGYVSEKVYQALGSDCVVVYFGAPDVRELIHPQIRDLLIVANDYTPAKLAVVLKDPITYPTYRSRMNMFLASIHNGTINAAKLREEADTHSIHQMGARSFITRLITKYLGAP